MRPEPESRNRRPRRPATGAVVAGFTMVLAAGLAIPAALPQIDPPAPPQSTTGPWVALGIRVIRAGMEEGPEDVRECAWKGLVRVDLPEVMQMLEQTLNHPDRQVRIAAARTLRERADPLVLPVVLRELQAHTWRIRQEALHDYARIAGADAIPTLRQYLLNTSQPSAVRAAAADGLGLLRAEESVDDLLAQLAAEQDNLRFHALLALGEIGSSRSVPALLTHLEDLDDRHETALTARALALSGDPHGFSLVENDLRSSNPRYRQMARATLMERGRGSALRAFRRVLPHAGTAAQIELIIALAEAGDTGSIPALRRLLDGGDTYVAEVAAAALARLGDRSGYPILRDGLRDSRWRFGDPVHRLLAGVDDHAIGYLAQDLFRSSDPAEKFWAATILVRFDLAAADRYLERAARQNDSPVSRTAAETLARNGNWSILPVLAERLGEACAPGSEESLELLAQAPPDEVLPLLQLYARRGTPLERVNAAAVMLEILETHPAGADPLAASH